MVVRYGLQESTWVHYKQPLQGEDWDGEMRWQESGTSSVENVILISVAAPDESSHSAQNSCVFPFFPSKHTDNPSSFASAQAHDRRGWKASLCMPWATQPAATHYKVAANQLQQGSSGGA